MHLERDKEEIRQRNKSVGLNGSSLETLAANRSKVFHLEAVAEDRLFVGTEIKADTYEEAELYLRLVFREALLDNDKIEIVKVSEEWLH